MKVALVWDAPMNVAAVTTTTRVLLMKVFALMDANNGSLVSTAKKN